MLQLSFVKFKPNSYLLVEGNNKSDAFFIIQSGKVRCYSEVSIPGYAQPLLGPGDFVGVVPSMSGHSQNQTVVALTEVVAIMVKKDQYSDLIKNNTPVAMKIVRSFARDMRILNDQLTKLTLKKTSVDSPETMFLIGEYYEEAGFYYIAYYCYYQYVKQCPAGPNVQTAQKRMLGLQTRAKKTPYLEPSPDAIKEFPRDTMIFCECQTGADMFIIQEGVVRITKVIDGKEVVLALLKKGDMFGEMALLEDKPRSATAIAHENCRLMVVNKTNFNQMVSTQPQMIAKLTTTFADRIWAIYRQLANTQLTDLREKLIDMIALQLEKNRIVDNGETYKTDYTIVDIIKFCSIPEKDQSDAFYQIQNDQSIKIVSGHIAIPDVTQLINQAAFYRKQRAKHND